MPVEPTLTSSEPPDGPGLHDTALAYLSRYAATEATLRRVLMRRIERWARRAAATSDPDTLAVQTAAARVSVDRIVARLLAAGAVNDAAFAEGRARSLMRGGRSRAAAAAYLAAKGVEPELARSVLPADEQSEVAAALVLARRRRIGPFRPAATLDAAGRHRELGVLARAGFPRAVARRALEMGAVEAEALVEAFRR